MADDLTVLLVDQFGADEPDAAKRYWSSKPFAFYVKSQPWSERMADRVLSFSPTSVLEFGCNAGKNLKAIRDKDASVAVHGLDINAPAIKHAQALGLGCGVGDETALRAFPDNAFDLAFTISVLDHLPYPELALVELLRISRTAVILYEPWLGVEGRVTERAIPGADRVACTPFSYSWNYPKLVAEHAPGWAIAVEEAPLEAEQSRGWAEFYRLHTLTPRVPG